MIQFMLDIETLGSRPGCPVFQFAVVAFDADNPRVLEETAYTFEVHLDVNEQFALGVLPDWDAIVFWTRQSADARGILQHPLTRVPFKRALVELKAYLEVVGPDFADRRLWSRGPDFDVGSLRMLSHLVGAFWPFPYNAVRDVRTLLEQVPKAKVYDVCPEAEEPPWRGAKLVKHQAIHDCVIQARQVTRAIQALREPTVQP